MTGGMLRDTSDKVDAIERFDENKGYCSPNSEKYQSGMSLVDISPVEITGFRSTAAEKKEGNFAMTTFEVLSLGCDVTKDKYEYSR